MKRRQSKSENREDEDVWSYGEYWGVGDWKVNHLGIVQKTMSVSMKRARMSTRTGEIDLGAMGENREFVCGLTQIFLQRVQYL